MADLKIENFQMGLKNKENSLKVEELKTSVIDMNAELQCARQAIQEAGPAVAKKY